MWTWQIWSSFHLLDSPEACYSEWHCGFLLGKSRWFPQMLQWSSVFYRNDRFLHVVVSGHEDGAESEAAEGPNLGDFHDRSDVLRLMTESPNPRRRTRLMRHRSEPWESHISQLLLRDIWDIIDIIEYLVTLKQSFFCQRCFLLNLMASVVFWKTTELKAEKCTNLQVFVGTSRWRGDCRCNPRGLQGPDTPGPPECRRVGCWWMFYNTHRIHVWYIYLHLP